VPRPYLAKNFTCRRRAQGARRPVIVVDASAILEILLNTPTGSKVAARLSGPGETLHAPHLLDIEVTQVLRRYSLAGDLDENRGDQAFADSALLPIERYPHGELLERIWQLRESLTACDAAYVVLAEALEAHLITCDARLSRTHGHEAKVEFIRI
jgi:predicted nucleic acid-binding protein